MNPEKPAPVLTAPTTRAAAAGVVDRVVLPELPHIPRADLLTSLVRQWLTCDGKAVFLTLDLLHLTLPADESRDLSVIVRRIPAGAWFDRWAASWDVDTDAFARIVGQLNGGQSAVLTNRQGHELRVWLDPVSGGAGVEALDQNVKLAAGPVDYLAIARNVVRQVFGLDLPTEDAEALAAGLARQWAANAGAGVFLLPDRVVRLRLNPRENGNVAVETRNELKDVAAELMAMGIAVDYIPDALRRLNVGQAVNSTSPVASRSIESS